jgi:hypothetical protein
MNVIDFEALRCPNAQIRLNAILHAFLTASSEKIQIKSIEPSLERSLKERIAHFDLPLQIGNIAQIPIDATHRHVWSANFDEEDFGDVNNILVFTIERLQK